MCKAGGMRQEADSRDEVMHDRKERSEVAESSHKVMRNDLPGRLPGMATPGAKSMEIRQMWPGGLIRSH